MNAIFLLSILNSSRWIKCTKCKVYGGYMLTAGGNATLHLCALDLGHVLVVLVDWVEMLSLHDRYIDLELVNTQEIKEW